MTNKIDEALKALDMLSERIKGIADPMLKGWDIAPDLGGINTIRSALESMKWQPIDHEAKNGERVIVLRYNGRITGAKFVRHHNVWRTDTGHIIGTFDPVKYIPQPPESEGV